MMGHGYSINELVTDDFYVDIETILCSIMKYVTK